MDISNLKVKLKTINPYYSDTSVVNSITSNAYNIIWSAKYASIEESGMYLISVSIKFGQSFNYWWGGILPIFTATEGANYSEKYIVGLQAGTGGNRILTGGVGSTLIELYYTPNNTNLGSILYVKGDSTTTYSITNSKIEALKVGNVIF